MQSVIRAWTVLIAAGLVCSCATTSVSSFTDPDYQDATFQTVAIWVDSTDLEWRQDLETSMVEDVLTTTGATAVRVLDIAPPTRAYDTTSMFQLIEEAGFEAVVVVEVTDTGVVQSVHGDEDGVYTTDSPWATSSVALYDVESGAMAWTATANTEGNRFSDWGEVRRSAGDEVIATLLENGLLPPGSDD